MIDVAQFSHKPLGSVIARSWFVEGQCVVTAKTELLYPRGALLPSVTGFTAFPKQKSWEVVPSVFLEWCYIHCLAGAFCFQIPSNSGGLGFLCGWWCGVFFFSMKLRKQKLVCVFLDLICILVKEWLDEWNMNLSLIPSDTTFMFSPEIVMWKQITVFFPDKNILAQFSRFHCNCIWWAWNDFLGSVMGWIFSEGNYLMKNVWER